VFEIVPALLGRVEGVDVADSSPERADRPGTDAPEMSFEFGERHLNWVEV